ADLERAIANATRDAPAAQEVRRYLDGSFAFALLNPPGAKRTADWMLIAGTTQPRQVAGVLTRRGQARRLADLAYWSLEQPDVCAMLIHSYLVVAGNVEALAQVQAVAQGRIASIEGVAGFREARDEMHGDANLLLFVSPS